MPTHIAAVATRPRGVIEVASAAGEQAWNTERMSRLVDEPDHRVWLHSAAAVVLGNGQKPPVTACDAGLPVITRESGGGAVAVGPWLVSTSIALPVRHPLVTPSLVHSYRWLGEAHARVLRAFGVNATAISPSAVQDACAHGPADVRWACFGALSPWEVVGPGRRKLVGLAQVRRRTGVLLVAGTLMWAPDWRTLAASMGRPPGDGDGLSQLTTDCESELGWRLSAAVFATALNEELRRSTTPDHARMT